MTNGAAPIRTYRAIHRFDLEENVWNVQIESEPRCHTFGKTLREARTTIREALELWLNLDEGVSLAEAGVVLAEVFVVPGVPDELLALSLDRDRLERETRQLQERTRVGARELVGAGLTTRDAATVLGVSHQRVAQLFGGAEAAGWQTRRRRAAVHT